MVIWVFFLGCYVCYFSIVCEMTCFYLFLDSFEGGISFVFTVFLVMGWGLF